MARRRNPRYLSIDEVKANIKKKLAEKRKARQLLYNYRKEGGFFTEIIDTEGVVIEESKLLEEKKDE